MKGYHIRGGGYPRYFGLRIKITFSGGQVRIIPAKGQVISVPSDSCLAKKILINKHKKGPSKRSI
jgi:hypothetical protein